MKHLLILWFFAGSGMYCWVKVLVNYFKDSGS